jgi:hypothetical protein
MATDDYLAGVFDGEGSVSMSLAKRKGKRAAGVFVEVL